MHKFCDHIHISIISSILKKSEHHEHPVFLRHMRSELCGLPVIQYRIHLVAWMKKHKSALRVAQQWCQACGQDIIDYYDHLGAGGQPLMDIQPVSEGTDSSSMEIDPDQELVQVVHPVKPKVKCLGKSSPQLYMLCRVGLKSQTALNFHLKQCHPDQRPNHCIECMNSFVNRADLQSHTSNVHTEKKIKCKHCEHRTVTKAKM